MESEIAARSSTVEEECAATGAGATLPGRFERWTLGVRWKLSFGASDGSASPRLGTPSSSHHRTATGEAYRYQ